MTAPVDCETLPPGLFAAEIVTFVCLSPSATMIALTSHGRLFERVRDPRHFNDGRPGSEKWLWLEIDGPLEAPS